MIVLGADVPMRKVTYTEEKFTVEDDLKEIMWSGLLFTPMRNLLPLS